MLLKTLRKRKILNLFLVVVLLLVVVPFLVSAADVVVSPATDEVNRYNLSADVQTDLEGNRDVLVDGSVAFVSDTILGHTRNVADFEAADAEDRIFNSTVTQSCANGCSVAFWTKQESITEHYPFGFATTDGGAAGCNHPQLQGCFFADGSLGELAVHSNSVQRFVQTTGSPSGEWVHYVVVINGSSGHELWVNGVQNLTSTSSFAPTASGIFIGRGAQFWYDGRIACFRMFNASLIDTQINNLSVNTDCAPLRDLPFVAGPGEISELTVTATNISDSVAIQNLSVTIFNSTTTLTNGTTSGTVKFGNLANLTTMTVNISSNETGGFFNISQDLLINLSTTLQAVMWKSQIRFTAQETDGNLSITSFNVSTPSNNNVSNSAGVLFLHTGLGSVLLEASAADHINRTVAFNTTILTTHNLTLFFGTGIFNVSAQETFTLVPLSDFTITIFNASELFSVTNVTDTGLSQFSLVDGLFSGLATAIDYVDTLFTFDFTTTKNFTVTMPPNNSVLIRIFDETTGLLIDDQNMTIDLISPSVPVTLNFTTPNGTLFERFLVPTTYDVSIASVGPDYTRRNFLVTLAAGSHIALDAYMLNTSAGTSIEFFVKDPFDKLLEGATLLVQRQLNDTFVTVAQDETDFTGAVLLFLDTTVEYTITVTATGFNTKVVTVTPQTSLVYTIFLEETTTIDFTEFFNLIQFNINPEGGVVDAVLQNFTFILTSPTAILDWFAIRSDFNNTITLTNNSASPGGGTIFITLNLTPNLGDAFQVNYIIKANGFDQFTINQSYNVGLVRGASGTLDAAVQTSLIELTDNIKVLVIMFIAAILAFVLSRIGFSGMASGMAAIMVLMVGGSIAFLDPRIASFTVLIGIIVYMAFGRGGGET